MANAGEPWKVLVDLASIVSAVFTAGAVVVSLYLARRSEAQRLRLFVGIDLVFEIGPAPRTEAETMAHEVRFTAVNAGVLPVTVRDAAFDVRLRGTDAVSYGLTSRQARGQNKAFPLVLEHGDEVSFTVSLRELARQWPNWSPVIGMIRRPRFSVATSLGILHTRRVPIRLLREIHTMCLAISRTPAFVEAATRKERSRAKLRDEMQKLYAQGDKSVAQGSQAECAEGASQPAP